MTNVTHELTPDLADTGDQKFGRMGEMLEMSKHLFGKGVGPGVAAGNKCSAQLFFINDELQCEVTGVFVVQAFVVEQCSVRERCSSRLGAARPHVESGIINLRYCHLFTLYFISESKSPGQRTKGNQMDEGALKHPHTRASNLLLTTTCSGTGPCSRSETALLMRNQFRFGRPLHPTTH